MALKGHFEINWPLATLAKYDEKCSKIFRYLLFSSHNLINVWQYDRRGLSLYWCYKKSVTSIIFSKNNVKSSTDTIWRTGTVRFLCQKVARVEAQLLRWVDSSDAFWLKFCYGRSRKMLQSCAKKYINMSVWSKMALGEVGVSLPWWCHTHVLLKVR